MLQVKEFVSQSIGQFEIDYKKAIKEIKNKKNEKKRIKTRKC